ncbi:MAG TPA: TPM domain-containing protein [Verrucomicrobiae bacterium]|nr:TPM domain-containing protein [Verrucomicrobiae bacterium]
MKPCCAILILLFGLRVFADEVIPPAPPQYFNDYANVVSPATASQLNATLDNFERQSSDQILVAIFPKMQSDSSIEDYTVRVARAWQVGQKNKNNGAVLFIFVQDRSMFIEVGYGLEGVLPDALCKRIIDEQISPRFHTGDFDGGCMAGVQAILAAVKGEYQGTGRTVAQNQYFASQRHSQTVGQIFTGIFISIFVLAAIASIRRRGGWTGPGGMIITSGGWGGFSGGGGWGGGGFSGGFSGGGGSFGGGGAGGHW